MNNFLQLEDQRKALIFSQTAVKTSMPSYVIEKDWWVTEMLRIVFLCRMPMLLSSKVALH